MKPFLILSPGGFIDDHGIEITISSFIGLFHNVTPKHQKQLKLVIIEEEDNIPQLMTIIKKERISSATEIIKRSEISKVEEAYERSTIFLYPSVKQIYKIIPEALSYALPVLTFGTSDTKEILDNSCSMVMRKSKIYDAGEEFSQMLEMLYFDPEVRKILAKGAKEKYQNDLQWGSKQRQTA